MQVNKVVNSIFTSNTYILSDEQCNYCWLVDIGDIAPVLSLIGNKQVKGLLLTHSHYDHMYGINKLVELFPDCVIYTSEEGIIGLKSDRINFSRYHEDPISFESTKIHVLSDGENIELFPDVVLVALLTPGHEKSCVSYYNDEILFSGDSYIPGFKVVTKFPRSNVKDSEESLSRILELIRTRKLYPGHQ